MVWHSHCASQLLHLIKQVYDGLVRNGHDGFYNADFNAGTLYDIEKDGSFETVLDLKPGSADFGPVQQWAHGGHPANAGKRNRGLFCEVVI